MNTDQLIEKEAVDFAIWLSDEMYTPHDSKSGYWYDTHGREYTSYELYQTYNANR